MSDTIRIPTADFVAPSASKATDAQVTEALRELGLCKTIFWRPAVAGDVHRISPTIVEITRAWLSLEVEEIVRRVKAKLAPIPTKRYPTRPADDVLHAINHDQGRLDDTDHTAQYPNVLTEAWREIQKNNDETPITIDSVMRDAAGDPPKVTRAKKSKYVQDGAPKHAAPKHAAPKREPNVSTELRQPKLSPPMHQFTPANPIPSERTIDDVIHDMMTVEQDYVRRKAELRDEIVAIASRSVVTAVVAAGPADDIAGAYSKPVKTSSGGGYVKKGYQKTREGKTYKCSKCGHSKPGASSKCFNCRKINE